MRLIKKSEMAKMQRGTLYYDDFSEFLLFRGLCKAGLIKTKKKRNSYESTNQIQG